MPIRLERHGTGPDSRPSPCHERTIETAYTAGWDRIREERFQRMRRLGVIDERYPFPPRPAGVPAWEEAEKKAEWARLMAVYAAMIDRMDQGIGRILRALDDTGERENTVIFFLSDNGGTAETVAGRKLNDPSVPIGSRGSYVAYLEPWANVSNTPFRLYKNWLHEGGIITPLIVNWPGRISEPGRLTDGVGHVIDLMPTVLELTGARYPAAMNAGPLKPLEGRSLAPFFRGGAEGRRTPLYWAHGGNWAIRDGDWKLALDGRQPGRPELFNMAEDPAESRDVAPQHPARVAELQGRWEAWARRMGAREARP